MRRMLLFAAVSALMVMATSQIVNAQALGFVNDNVLEGEGETIPMGFANFGVPFTYAGMSWPVELAHDSDTQSCVNPAIPSTPTDACEPLDNDMTGKIALVDRGCCAFVTKLENVFNAGAEAMVVANRAPDFIDAPYWQLWLGATPGYPDLIEIPSGMISKNDRARLLSWAGPVTARKVGVEEHQAALDGSVVNFRTMLTGNQLVAMFRWIGTLPEIGVVKPAHAQALNNKVVTAFTQYGKGNTNAVIGKMEDIIEQVGELEAKGQFDSAFAAALMADAQSVIDGIGM